MRHLKSFKIFESEIHPMTKNMITTALSKYNEKQIEDYIEKTGGETNLDKLRTMINNPENKDIKEMLVLVHNFVQENEPRS